MVVRFGGGENSLQDLLDNTDQCHVGGFECHVGGLVFVCSNYGASSEAWLLFYLPYFLGYKTDFFPSKTIPKI